MQLNQVLHLSARAIETVVDPFRRSGGDARDDKADVEPKRGRLDAGDGAALAAPGFGSVPRLGVTAHDRLAGQSAFGADRVGRLIDLPRQRLSRRAVRKYSRRRFPHTTPSPRAARNARRPET